MINIRDKLHKFKILKVINLLGFIELIAWILAFKQHITWCLIIVILYNAIENIKENTEVNQLKQRVELLENKIDK